MSDDQRKAYSTPPGDEIFSGLSKDPLADAGYGPVPHVSKPKKPEHLGRKLLIALVVLVVAGALVAGGMALAKHKKGKPAASKVTTTSSTNSAPATGAENTNAAANTKTYTSTETALPLTLSYPDGWTPSPATTSANGTNNVTLTSPQVTFTDASGVSVTGKAVVTIRPGSAGIDEITSTPATAAQSSVQIGYTNPTSGQHKFPFISFLHFTTGEKASGAFEEVLITGVTPFKSGDAVSMSGLAGLDPIISVSFYSCNGNACTTPLSITNNEWTTNATALEALNIFESLQLQ